MKKRYALLFAGCLTISAGCESFLDINDNPNAPQTVAANLYLAPMLHWMVTSPQFDARYITRYTQQLTVPGTSLSTWDRMGFDAPPSDNGAQMWRDVYWSLGQNLIDMNRKAQAEQRWDLLGVGLVLKAWGWQVLTDVHGEIIVKEAIPQDNLTYSYNYDSQQYAYEEVKRLLDSAIVLLSIPAGPDNAVDATYMAKGDKIYNGDRTKWLKYARGLRAIHLNHYTNKGTKYNPDAVIADVDASFVGNADDALLAYPGTQATNDDNNFLGRTRNNFTTFRQTQFVVGLLDGTVFTAVDPRLSRMLVLDSANTTYRGLDPKVVNFGALTVPQQPRNPFGYTGTGGAQLPGRYILDDKAKVPAMTYAQLQFIKAEAAFRKGDKATALTAYTAAVSAHIDFVNARNLDNSQPVPQITPAEKAAFLANANIVPTAANLTMTHIMSQKYIAQWMWGHTELWMDMRRYHYTDTFTGEARQVYPGFSPPTSLAVENNGKITYRIRPRYNSEYVWNRPGLDAIGGLAGDYHTKQTCITDPTCPWP